MSKSETSLKPDILKKSGLDEKACKRGKCIIQLVLMFASLLSFLFGSFLSYTDGAFSFSLSGAGVFELIFYGGKIGYVNYGTTVYLTVPAVAVLISVLCIAMPIIFACISAITCFVKGKDAEKLGIFEMAFAGILVILYIILLTTSVFKAENSEGESFTFYKLYEIKPAFLFAVILYAAAGGIQKFLSLKKIPGVKRYVAFYAILIVPTILILVFNVYPSLLQTILAFKNYLLIDGVWGSEWAGLENFHTLVADSQMRMVIWQTVYLSFLRLVAGIIPPVIFALVFYHITSKKYRAVIQTIVYIPHFFSWVVIYAIVSAFLTPNGLLNKLIVNVFHGEPVDFLSKPELFYTNMILSSVWKEVGWGTILFTASLMGIDKSLYEAAAIDGAGVFRKLWHITLPGMTGILVYNVIMSVGNILKGAGGEQILIFATGAVQENKALVIDTWLYWKGLKEIQYGLSGAVSFVQAVIGFVMVIGAHKLSKKLVGIGAW